MNLELPGTLPFWTRVRNSLRLAFRSRGLLDYEWQYIYDLETPKIIVLFYVERRPLRFKLFFPNLADISVKDVAFKLGADLIPVPCAIDRQPGPEGLTVTISPVKPLPVSRVEFIFEGTEGPIEPPGVKVVATNDIPEDLRLLQGAFAYAEKEDMVNPAIEDFTEYETSAGFNPAATGALSTLYRKKGRQDDAEEYAIRSLVSLPTDQSQGLYHDLREERPPTPIEDIRKLQKEAAKWPVEQHHGLVVLQRNRHFWLGLNGWHLKKGHELIEVRRPAAGRFLTTIGFPYSTNEYILHTKLSVVHKNGEVESVKDENFTVSDSSERNIFITVEDEKRGNWILPDLSPGDVIDWSYDLIAQDNGPGESKDFFILTSLFDSKLPTYRGSSEFCFPDDLPVKFACRNRKLEPARETVKNGRLHKTTYEGLCYVPEKNTNFPYENVYLNPILACSHEATAWPDVAEHALEINFGNEEIEDELPEPIRQAVEGRSGIAALEQAFYWIRDKLKYASLRSGIKHIGHTTRAATIVELGTGDCKDKTYLLAMVCRKFGIPFEYVMISTKNGILIDDLPAQQFDHVFLRAKAEDDWLYLDAANSYASFGSPPAWCQGMQALILNREGSIITIPADVPEANRFEIAETFDSVSDGWLQGSFDFQARGQSGRLANERAKGLSLMMSDSQQAAQESLNPYMPFIVLQNHSRISDTGSSGLFHVSGRHRRSPLVMLGKNGKQVGRLAWNVPSLPLGYWRNMSMDKLFVMDFPLQISVQITLEGVLFQNLDDLSRIDSLENDLCRIVETVTERDTAVTISREIIFRERFVRGERLRQVAPSLDALEKSLLLVMAFGGTAGGNRRTSE